MAYTPARGDVIWLDFTPQAGHEQAGRRPAVVLTPTEFNQHGMAVCCPLTTKPKGYPFEAPIPPGLPIHGAVLVHQMKCVDWTVRKAEFECRMPAGTMKHIYELLDEMIFP